MNALTCTLLEELERTVPNPRALGGWGERYARAWLEQRGWLWLSSNWQTRYGELDLVMLDPSRSLVFVEVKTRRSTRYGPPEEAIGTHKRLALRRAGIQWLLEPAHRVAHDGVRFDVIAIRISQGRPRLTHIPEAF